MEVGGEVDYIYNICVGISQANRALTKPSRAKIRSKTFPLKKHSWTLLYTLSLSLSLYVYTYLPIATPSPPE